MSYSADPELDAQRHTDEQAAQQEAQDKAYKCFKEAFMLAAGKKDAMTTLLGCVDEKGRRMPLHETVREMLGCGYIAKQVVEYILKKAQEDREAWLIVDDWAIRYANTECQS